MNVWEWLQYELSMHKHKHSLCFQLVCDDNMLFTDVLASWPGSVHDSRVLRNSELWSNAANKFPGDTHLLGDGGYPLLRYQETVLCLA